MKSLKNFAGMFLLIGLSILTGCGSQQGGRVTVVLDNSGSMSWTGTSFEEIKQSLFNALLLVPGSYESGLRVFSHGGSRLVSPYNRDLTPLRQTLKDIYPEEGTYIGQSLLDAANDMLEKPYGDNRLIFVTDGEGSDSDIEDARQAKDLLANLQGGFKCNFILFSAREDVLNETPIGRVSQILGCDLKVPGDYPSAKMLTPTLLRIFGFDFYWIWLILSALAYITLIVFTSYLVFDLQYAQGVLPRIARLIAIGFIFVLLPVVMGAHIIGLFAGLSDIVWGLVVIATVIVVIAVIGVGKDHKHLKDEGEEDDPFA